MLIEPQSGKPTTVRILLTVVLAALIAGGLVYVAQGKKNTDTKADLQAQVDSLKAQVAALPTATPTPVASATPTPSATPDQTANWKTYSDTSTGLSFKYPDTVTLNPTEKTSGIALNVHVQAIDKIADAPLWYGPEAAKEELAALTKNDIGKTRNADKLLSLTGGAVGATNLVLSQLSCDNVMFNREAHIYRKNFQIMIGLAHNDVDTIKAANPTYFAVDPDCSTEMSWSNQTQFTTDLAAGKTDAESQRWNTMFQQIISTIKFK